MYDWILVLHIAAWTSWMAGLFYLPRLFVYHAERAVGRPEMAETFNVMQHKLLRLIMTPAMAVTWITGLALALGWWDLASSGWLHAKIALVVAMSAFHGYCVRWKKAFEAGENAHAGRYFRIANEVPTVLFLLIVILAILKPF